MNCDTNNEIALRRRSTFGHFDSATTHPMTRTALSSGLETKANDVTLKSWNINLSTEGKFGEGHRQGHFKVVSTSRELTV
jgi:hypothetical protein